MSSELRSEYEANLALSPRHVVPGNRTYERIERFTVVNWGGYDNGVLRVVEYEVVDLNEWPTTWRF